MPVQMVCDSTSLVSAALRDTLTSAGGGGSSGGGLGGGSSMSAASSSSYFGVSSLGNNNSSRLQDPDEEEELLVDRFENQLADALRRKQLKPIRYEEVPNYSSEQDSLKSKYIVLKAPTASLSNGINGSSGSNGGSSTNTQLMNGGGGGRGNPSSSVTSKLSASNAATCNGISSLQSKYPQRLLFMDETSNELERLKGGTTGHFPSPKSAVCLKLPNNAMESVFVCVPLRYDR